MHRTFAIAALSILLVACASGDGGSFRSSSAAPQGPSVISGSGGSGGGSFAATISGPPGCAGPISEYQQIIDRDVESGMLNPGVYNRVSTDLEPAKRACAEGKEKEAQGQLAAVKSRYGYR
jgi:hypothetical protein